MRMTLSLGTLAAMIAGALSPIFTGSASAGTKICFEAEKTTDLKPHMYIKTTKDKRVSGGGYLSTPPGVCGKDKKDLRGYANYTFTVEKPGYYYLWARTLWEDGCGNSVGVKVNDGPQLVLGQDGTYGRWHWVQVKKKRFKLSKGENKLQLIVREDGVSVDQVFLTDDKGYIPTSIRKVTVK